MECRPLKVFCDGKPDCPNRSDEWDFCKSNSTGCLEMRCGHGCALTPAGAKCYCPEGRRWNGSLCVDADECEVDGTCAQICHNLEGSFACSCVSGYIKNGSDCLAVNGKCFCVSNLMMQNKTVTLTKKPIRVLIIFF